MNISDTLTVTQGPTTQERIAEYEQRLSTGFDKLRELELAGRWNEPMYAYYLTLEAAYIKLCQAAKLFGEY